MRPLAMLMSVLACVPSRATVPSVLSPCSLQEYLCASAGDLPSAPAVCRWSNLWDDPGGNLGIFPPSAPHGLKRISSGRP